MTENRTATRVLIANTLAFTVCFAVWMMNGVLVTFLVDRGVFAFSKVEMGWLIGVPVLTGSILRLPVGLLTDRFGGRPVFTVLMVMTAAAALLGSFADGFWGFFLGGLGFGLAGTGFAAGVGFTSVWFPKSQQGTALGIFGAGNAGAALTTLGAPWLLGVLTRDGQDLERWRALPRIYALVLLVTAALFWVSTVNRKPQEGATRSLAQRLAPLGKVRVWRFGLYYFLVFGGFVALAQWLIPYYVNAYGVSIVTAGLLVSIFSLPSGVIRALGGWMSDRFGARAVMYWILGGCALCSVALVVPRMDLYTPGEGVMATRAGTVTAVGPDFVQVGDTRYAIQPKPTEAIAEPEVLIWPARSFGQVPVVRVGDTVQKKQLLARGDTHIFFQANVWVFTVLVFVIGILMGIGKAAVYKHIPDYYPNDVGTVGGIVGVIGGLGGFVCPIVFGYLLRGTGLWTTTWVFFAVLSVVCLVWMHWTIRKMTARRAPDIAQRIEDVEPGRSVALALVCPVHGTRARVRLLGGAAPGSGTRVGACSLSGDPVGNSACLGACVVATADEQREVGGSKA